MTPKHANIFGELLSSKMGRPIVARGAQGLISRADLELPSEQGFGPRTGGIGRKDQLFRIMSWIMIWL